MQRGVSGSVGVVDVSTLTPHTHASSNTDDRERTIQQRGPRSQKKWKKHGASPHPRQAHLAPQTWRTPVVMKVAVMAAILKVGWGLCGCVWGGCEGESIFWESLRRAAGLSNFCHRTFALLPQRSARQFPLTSYLGFSPWTFSLVTARRGPCGRTRRAGWRGGRGRGSRPRAFAGRGRPREDGVRHAHGRGRTMHLGLVPLSSDMARATHPPV